MKRLRASAPGKAVLSGEYAVLGGAPAVSMAVNRRVVVEIREAAGEHHVIATPGLADGCWRFRQQGPRVTWLDVPPGGALDLVTAVWESLGVSPTGAMALCIDSRSFFDPGSGSKLGLGSSAASVSALVAALAEWTGARSAVAAAALEAHRRLQRGHGSGVDVATSVRGGLIEYRVQRPMAPACLEWPPGLHYRFLWSRQPADTTALIRKLPADAFSAGTGGALSQAAEKVAACYRSGDGIPAAMDAYGDCLRRFGEAHGLGIYAAGHDVVAGLARRHEVVYKPCGAGGGDIGIALADDAAAIDRLIGDLGDTGFVPLSLALDTHGIVVEN